MQQSNKLNSMKQQNHQILKLQTKKYPLYKPPFNAEVASLSRPRVPTGSNSVAEETKQQ